MVERKPSGFKVCSSVRGDTAESRVVLAPVLPRNLAETATRAASRSPTSPLGDAIETFVRREDAERFIEEIRGDGSWRAG